MVTQFFRHENGSFHPSIDVEGFGAADFALMMSERPIVACSTAGRAPSVWPNALVVTGCETVITLH